MPQTGRFLFLSFTAVLFEKIAQHLGGFRGVVRYLCNAGAPQMTVCVKYARIGRYAAALFIRGGKVYVAHTRKRYRRGAHCAWLQRYVYVAFVQKFPPQFFARPVDCNDFSMQGRVLFLLNLVFAARDYFPVTDNNGANRHVAMFGGAAG